MEYAFYQLAWFFLIYSFLGWFLETALAAVRRGRLLNRGFLNAPFSPSYGLGAVLFAVFLPDLRADPFFLFLGGMLLATALELLTGMLLATALELLTGMLLEKLFGQKWWDYSEQPWNFNGYICLKYAVAWGLFALFCLYLGNPLLVSLTQWIPPLAGRVLLLVMAALLLLDLLSSLAAVLQLSGSLPPVAGPFRGAGQWGDPAYPAAYGPGLSQPGAGTAQAPAGNSRRPDLCPGLRLL